MGIKYLYYVRSSKRAPDPFIRRYDQSLLLYPFYPISSISKPISKLGQIALVQFPQSLPLSLLHRYFQTKPWMQVASRARSKAPRRQGNRLQQAGCQNQGVRPVPLHYIKYPPYLYIYYITRITNGIIYINPNIQILSNFSFQSFF